MDFDTREDGTRVIHIPAKDLKDFEINICGARGLQIDSTAKRSESGGTTHFAVKIRASTFLIPSQTGIRLINTDGTYFPVLIVFG